MKAIVLLSGGIDSTICALMAGKEFGFENVAGVSFQYGQKHSKENEASKNIASHLGLGGWEEINIPEKIFQGAGSTLIDSDEEIPSGPYSDSIGPASTYVPFRNGTLISIATAYALKTGAENIYFGAHAEDAMNWAYPDCTPEFLGAMKNAVLGWKLL